MLKQLEMEIKTERLVLREYRKGDKEDIRKNINKLNIIKYLLTVPYPYTMKDAKEWIKYCRKMSKAKQREHYSLAITLQEEDKVIGGIELSKVDKFQGTAEISYWLGEQYQRKGIASEAVAVMLKFAFEKLKLRKVFARFFEGNIASSKVLVKRGFEKEGLLRKAVRSKVDNSIKDVFFYGLLKEEWKDG